MISTESRSDEVKIVLTGADLVDGFVSSELTFTSAEYLGQSVAYPSSRFAEVAVFWARPCDALQKLMRRRGHREVAVLPALFEELTEVCRVPERRTFFVWAKPVSGGVQ